jgi:hypothetical protein
MHVKGQAGLLRVNDDPAAPRTPSEVTTSRDFTGEAFDEWLHALYGEAKRIVAPAVEPVPSGTTESSSAAPGSRSFSARRANGQHNRQVK